MEGRDQLALGHKAGASGREREIVEAGVQGRLVWLQEADDEEMGYSTKRGS